MTVNINRSVGKNASNQPTDVRAVRIRLNQFITEGNMGGPTLSLEGKVGNPTINAIKAFQAIYLGFNNPDGKVDPGGQTLSALNGSITQPRRGDPHDKTVQSVVTTLKCGQIPQLLFAMDGMTITPKCYSDVADAVQSRRLQAYYDPGQGANAEYFHKDGGYMLLGFVTAVTTMQKSIVVHEATHAICDRWAVTMPTFKAEALAHLAQAIYYYEATGGIIKVALATVNNVFKHCGAIAAWLKSTGHRSIRYTDIDELYRLATFLPSVQAGYGFYYDGW